VTLHGTVSRETFPGPPNYESIKDGDRPETSWFLDLTHPVCAQEDKTDLLKPGQEGVRRIQLVVSQAMCLSHKKLVGKRVAVTGTLFGEHTGHHHTPVLLTVNTLERAD
jgi:hypothetical protein